MFYGYDFIFIFQWIIVVAVGWVLLQIDFCFLKREEFWKLNLTPLFRFSPARNFTVHYKSYTV